MPASGGPRGAKAGNEAPGGRQAAGGQQDRRGRNGDSQLVGKHVQGQDDLAVLDDKGQEVAHGLSLDAGPLGRAVPTRIQSTSLRTCLAR
jgi:hypothetical protein